MCVGRCVGTAAAAAPVHWDGIPSCVFPACHLQDRTDRGPAGWLALLPAGDGRGRGQCALGLLPLGRARSYRNRTNWGRRGLPIIVWATTHHGTKPGATTRYRGVYVSRAVGERGGRDGRTLAYRTRAGSDGCLLVCLPHVERLGKQRDQAPCPALHASDGEVEKTGTGQLWLASSGGPHTIN